MLSPDMIGVHLPAVESFWPNSAIGWLNTGVIIFAAGRGIFNKATGRATTMKGIADTLGKFDERFQQYENASKIMAQQLGSIDRSLTDLSHEVLGVRGDNGMKKTMQRLCEDVEAIEARNQQADIFNALVEMALSNYEGPERRESMRQLRDHLRKTTK